MFGSAEADHGRHDAMNDRSAHPSAPGARICYEEQFAAGPGAWCTGRPVAEGTWHRNVLGELGHPVPLDWSDADGGHAWAQPPWYFDDNHGELFWLYLAFFVNRSDQIGLGGADLILALPQ